MKLNAAVNFRLPVGSPNIGGLILLFLRSICREKKDVVALGCVSCSSTREPESDSCVVATEHRFAEAVLNFMVQIWLQR